MDAIIFLKRKELHPSAEGFIFNLNKYDILSY